MGSSCMDYTKFETVIRGIKMQIGLRGKNLPVVIGFPSEYSKTSRLTGFNQPQGFEVRAKKFNGSYMLLVFKEK